MVQKKEEGGGKVGGGRRRVKSMRADCGADCGSLPFCHWTVGTSEFGRGLWNEALAISFGDKLNVGGKALLAACKQTAT